jgi:hypothetical protein
VNPGKESNMYQESQKRIATYVLCQQLKKLSPLDHLVAELRYRISTTLLVRVTKRDAR